MKVIFLNILFFFFISCQSQVKDAQDIINNPDGIINDYGQIFSKNQKKILRDKLFQYHLNTNRQIIVVTVNSIAPYNDIVKFAADIGNTWGVGEYEKDNGIVVLICKPCRNIGIAVGTGIEDVLTDEICKEIIQKTMIPEFKTDNFYEGTFNGITALIEKF